jgi:hypothetical protein
MPWAMATTGPFRGTSASLAPDSTWAAAGRCDQDAANEQDGARQDPPAGQLSQAAIGRHAGEEDAGHRAEEAEQRDADADG